MRTIAVKFTRADLGEVFYALESKIMDLEHGRYGVTDDDVNIEKWASQLRRIAARVVKVSGGIL